MGKATTEDTSTEAEKTKAPASKEATTEASESKGDDNSLDHGKGPLETSLKGYLRSCGKRLDQMAAFASFAAREMPGRHTQQDWEQAFSEFCAKPLR